MIVNIITVKAVRNIPICVKSLSVMYTASPPFKVLWHLREMNWPPDVQGFPREYFSILSWEMQLVRTWQRLDFMLYYRYKKRETTDGRSLVTINNRSQFATGGGYFFLFIKFITKEMILNIITVNPVRKIPIWIKLSRVMYTASPPFKVLSHFREMNWPPIVQGFPQNKLYHARFVFVK